MALEFEVSAEIPASPEAIYDAWLDTDGHTRMTGSPAKVSADPGAAFEAWDGYIQGKNLQLDRGRRIVQSWRTTHFEASDPDSRIEVTFQPTKDGTKVVLRHTELPPHGTQYEKGWGTHYFEPMRRYFEG